VEAARAQVIDAELNLGYCTITSPVAGATSYAKQQDGSYVSPENSLLTYVARLDPMRVNFSLSENEVLRIRGEKASGALDLPPQENFEVEIVLADGSKFPGKGRLTFTDASFSQETGTFLLRAELPNPQGSLKPGQFVRVRLIGAKRPGSFVIPQRAVQQGPRGEFVWLVDKDGKAEQRVVEVGDWIGDDWLIRKGLRPGERLIVDGALKLAPGVPVKATDLAVVATAASSPVGAGGTGFAPAATPGRPAPAGGGTGGGAYAAAAPAAAGSGPAGMQPADPDDAVNRPSVAVYFDTGSAVLRNDAVQQLRSMAQWLATNPQRGVALSGYADKRGSAGANAALAKQRAQNVRGALLVAGADEAQIELQAPRSITGGSDDTLARRVDVMPRGAAKP
jgi:membrane fusion protein (multidrug efflux system)